MSAQHTPSDPGRTAATDRSSRVGSAHDSAEPLPPGTEHHHLTPAARQQLSASTDRGGSRQPGGHEASREQYGQRGDAAGQPSQFGGVPSQQHAGHAPRSGGTQDPRHAEEDDYAAPWGVYGGEYGQFDRSPGHQQAFGQQDLGFGRHTQPGPDRGEEAGRHPRWAGETGGQGPGAKQPWSGVESGSDAHGRSGANPYGPGQYGASAQGGPQHGTDPAWRDHDSQGSQDWQGYSGGAGWQPGPRGGWGAQGSERWSGHRSEHLGSRHEAGQDPGRDPNRDQGRYGSSHGSAGFSYGGAAGEPARYGRAPGHNDVPRYGQAVRSGLGEGRPRGDEAPWSQQPSGHPYAQPSHGGWSGPDAGPPVRDPSHDWGSRDAEPWGSRHRADDDRAWSGGPAGRPHDIPEDRERSFNNPYGPREGSGGPQLGEHQGSPYAGSRRGGIGSRAAGSGSGWDPSEHRGGRYGAQGFGASGYGGGGWSTPPGAGQPDSRPWDEQRGRHAGSGPASWQGEARGSGWRGEPGSGPSGDVDDWRGGRGGEDPYRQRRGELRDEGSYTASRVQQEPHHEDPHHHPHHHDPDYHQWRAEQLRNFDDDYRQWRQERYRRFSDEFNEWRQGRSRGSSSPIGPGPAQSSAGGQDTTPGGAQGSIGPAGTRPESAPDSTPGAGQPGSAHDVGVSGSTHPGSKPDPQGAAQGRTLPSAGGESRDTTGTSGGPGQPASSTSDPGRAGRAGKGKER
ncbi:MAG: hypothetical protein ACOZD0_13625 [Pseudomonadota bacterium]